MERIIPKNTKVSQTFFKGICLKDIIIVAIEIAFLIAAFTSNLGTFKYILMIVSAGLVGFSIISFDGTKGYTIMDKLFTYVVRKKKLNPAEAIVPMTDITGDRLVYPKYVGKVLEIQPIQFGLLDEAVQNGIITSFSEIFKNVTEETVQLIKLDRELDLNSNIQCLNANKQFVLNSKQFNENEKTVRAEIIDSQIETLKHVMTEKLYYSAYYMAVYAKDESIVDEKVKVIQDVLAVNKVVSKKLEGDELVRFVKANVVNKPDESEEFDRENPVAFITPQNYRLATDHIELNGQKQINLSVKEYPVIVGNAWGESLFDDDNTKVVLTAVQTNKDKLIKQLDRAVTEMREKTEKDIKESVLVESLTHLETLQNLLVQLKNENETVLDVNIDITFYPQGEFYKQERNDYKRKLRNHGFVADDLYCNQFEGFVNGNLSRANLLKNLKHGINSESLAAVFPFTSNKIIEENGVLIGVGRYPVLLNFFKRDDVHQNSNMFVIGSSGAGKSYYIKTLCTLLAGNGERIYLLDPHNEYVKMMRNLGGKVVDVSGRNSKMNPLQIVFIGEGSFDSQLQFLEEFFKVTCSNLKADSFELLNRLIVELYDKFNINANTDILKLKPSDYPIMDDLFEFVKNYANPTKNEYLARHIYTLTNFLFKFSNLGRYSSIWNGYTTLEIKENVIAFTFQTLFSNENSVVAKAQMLMLTRYVNNQVINNFNENEKNGTNNKTIVVIDEAHKFISKDNYVALTFMKRNAKELRKYGAMQIVATQSVQDFIANEDLTSESKAVISESQYSSIFRLTAPACDDFVKLYSSIGINDSERQLILTNDRGNTFFMGSSFERDSFQIVASDVVQEVID